MELLENADVTASIKACAWVLGEHGKAFYLFVFVYEVRISKFERSSVFVWAELVSKWLLVWRRIYCHTV